MSNFKHIEPSAIADNTVKMIGDDWMLITSANDTDEMVCGTDYNMMTASWGGIGVLWNRPVVFVFIRPQRHTFPFAEANDRLTLSFFDESYRPALSYCGKFSGRDADKFADGAVKRSANGLAVLEQYVNACISLKVEEYMDLGSHGMFLCSVTEEMILGEKETMTYTYYQNNVKPKPEAPKKKGWVCKICGYVYEGDPLPEDFICPWCKHPASDFEPLG